jgi:hypothetical protein
VTAESGSLARAERQRSATAQVRYQVTHDPDARAVAGALAEPQSVRQGAEAFVAATGAQTSQAVVDPQRRVRFGGEASFAEEQHGATLVTAF